MSDVSYPRLAVAVDEHTIEVAGETVFYRDAPGNGPTVLYLHSVPTSSDDWLDFLERGGGLAVDLLGFGRSSKASNLVYTLPSYVDFLERFLDTVDAGRLAIVGHGWGAALGLSFAQRHPERIEGLVLIDAVPLLEGFQWPPIVRRWRTIGVGELVMGSVNRWLLARTLRSGAVSPEAWPDARIAAVWEQFDQGTQRAMLRLHRSIDPAGLAAAGARPRAAVDAGARAVGRARSVAGAGVRRRLRTAPAERPGGAHRPGRALAVARSAGGR